MSENEQDLSMLDEMDTWMRVHDEIETIDYTFLDTNTGNNYVKTIEKLWMGSDTKLMFTPELLKPAAIKTPDPLAINNLLADDMPTIELRTSVSTDFSNHLTGGTVSCDVGTDDSTAVGTFTVNPLALTGKDVSYTGTTSLSAVKIEQQMYANNMRNIDDMENRIKKLQKEITYLENIQSPLRFSMSARQAEADEFNAVKMQMALEDHKNDNLQLFAAMGGNPPYSVKVEKHDFEHAMELVK